MALERPTLTRSDNTGFDKDAVNIVVSIQTGEELSKYLDEYRYNHCRVRQCWEGKELTQVARHLSHLFSMLTQEQEDHIQINYHGVCKMIDTIKEMEKEEEDIKTTMLIGMFRSSGDESSFQLSFAGHNMFEQKLVNLLCKYLYVNL